jgi:hypothetical protein
MLAHRPEFFPILPAPDFYQGPHSQFCGPAGHAHETVCFQNTGNEQHRIGTAAGKEKILSQKGKGPFPVYIAP